MNFIVKHDKTTFLDRLASFVEQVDDVDYINLFLTTIGYDPVQLYSVAH